jgi:hypothetical protein
MSPALADPTSEHVRVWCKAAMNNLKYTVMSDLHTAILIDAFNRNKTPVD